MKKGLVFVISGPGGAGKTTLVKKLLREFDRVVQSISYTTRHPRATELNGRDYHFVTKSEFEKMVAANNFLEHAKVYDDFYGTSQTFITQQQEKGKHVVLILDTQGAIQLMDRFAATFIFIHPPSLSELADRLAKRRSETEETLKQRLLWAQNEISQAYLYDYQIVNKDLEVAYQVLRSIVIAQEHKTR